MKANVRRFHSPDADLETFEPEDVRDVQVLVQIMVGPSGGPGEESFDVVVCTPSRLLRVVEDEGPLVGRHHLVVPIWDWPRIRLFLTDEVEAVDGVSWNDLASKLGRIGKWEFEDYQP
jgi:hypothetical protein